VGTPKQLSMPSPPVCLAIARVSFSSALPPVFNVRIISATTSPQRNELPRRFVTQTLPKLLNVLQILIGPALAELGAIRRATPPPLDELASFRECGGALSAYDRRLLSHLAAAAE
jgi:hypothetical protein